MEKRPVGLEAIQKLRPAFRRAITTRHLEDLPEPEAARRLEVPIPTLKARLTSAYEMLGGADFTKAREEYQKESRR